MTFATFKEFEEVFSKYQNQNNVQYYIKDSRLVASARKRLPNRYLNEKIMYYYVIYNCTHGGGYYPRSRSRAESPGNTKSCSCPATLRLSASEDGEQLVVTSFEEKHCHDDIGNSNLIFTHDLKEEPVKHKGNNKRKGEKRKGAGVSRRKSDTKVRGHVQVIKLQLLITSYFEKRVLLAVI